MSKLPLIALLLLSACGVTVGSADAICAIPTPTFTPEELQSLSEKTWVELDLFAQRFSTACGL